MVKNTEGQILTGPTISTSVEATISEQCKNDKIIVFKYKRRKNYKKKRGHKQPQTIVDINNITTK